MQLPAIVQQLVYDPLTYVLLAAIWIAKRYFDARIRRGVDDHFDQRLETLKQRLAVLTERARTDYQRELADFTLYATKRHAAAESVYAAARIAHGHVSALFGITVTLSFEEFNSEDIRAHMTSREVPRGKQEEILALWDSDRSAAILELRPYLRMLTVQEADRKFKEAKNATYLNELYLSDEVIAKLNALYGIMAEWLSYAEYPKEQGEHWTRDRKSFDAALEEVHTVLRAQLNPVPVAGVTSDN